MPTHFRIAQEHGVWNVYSVNNLVEPEEMFANLELAEQYVKETDRILGVLDKLHDEINTWAGRLMREHRIDYTRAVAWLSLAMMKLDDEIWGNETYPNSLITP